MERAGRGLFFRTLKTIGTEIRGPLLSYVENGGGLIAVCGAVGILGKKIMFPFIPIPTGMGVPTLGLFNYTARYGPKVGVVTLEPAGGEHMGLVRLDNDFARICALFATLVFFQSREKNSARVFFHEIEYYLPCPRQLFPFSLKKEARHFGV